VFAAISLAAAVVLAWQVWTVDAEQPDNPRFRFDSNKYVGIILSLALLAEWVW
jgi:4-hydroxybenzoate polyprenyltransferase